MHIMHIIHVMQQSNDSQISCTSQYKKPVIYDSSIGDRHLLPSTFQALPCLDSTLDKLYFFFSKNLLRLHRTSISHMTVLGLVEQSEWFSKSVLL